MSEVHIRWTQNVAGRQEGYEEVVERTEFIDGCLANNRLVIITDPVPEAVAQPVKVDVLKPRRKGFPDDVVIEPTIDVPMPGPVEPVE